MIIPVSSFSLISKKLFVEITFHHIPSFYFCPNPQIKNKHFFYLLSKTPYFSKRKFCIISIREVVWDTSRLRTLRVHYKITSKYKGRLAKKWVGQLPMTDKYERTQQRIYQYSGENEKATCLDQKDWGYFNWDTWWQQANNFLVLSYQMNRNFHYIFQ